MRNQLKRISILASVFCLLSLLSACEKSEGNSGTSAGVGNVQVLEAVNVSSRITAVGGVPQSVRIYDVSSDASVAVGLFSRNTVKFDDWQVFLYTKSGGIEDLGSLAKSINHLSISGDGRVLWGSFYVKGEGSRLFRYTRSRGKQDFGTLGKREITPYAASADGEIVVGSFLSQITAEKKIIHHAFRYSESGGFEDLGAMGGESAFARGVSANGAMVVGNVQTNGGGHAFRYSRQEGAQNIGSVDGRSTFASGISDEGVIAGSYSASLDFHLQRFRSHAFLYPRSGNFKRLGAMGGSSVTVVRISPDGSRIAGSYVNSARESHVYVAAIK